MKTLAQLVPRHDTIRWLDERQAGASVHHLGPPDYFYHAHHQGPYYFGWHEKCYTKRDLHRPVCSPATRRPVRIDPKHSFLCLWENYGSGHHRFKKLSSRRLRKALKREDAIELTECLAKYQKDFFEAYVHERIEWQKDLQSLTTLGLNFLDNLPV